jgi:L-iditol 2-dehydrogenase
MTMKAIVMYKPRDLRLEDIEVPEPQDDEVLVKVLAVGICGSDIPRINVYGAYISPIIPGHEFAGEIVDLNGGADGFKVGDRVTVPPIIPCHKCKYCLMGEYSLCESYSYLGSRCNGAFAQYVAVKKRNLLKVPDNVENICAATTDPLANALHGLKLGGFEPGKNLCIYGAGPIGLYMIQAAREMGAGKIAAVDVNEKKLAVAMESGADVVFNGLDEDVAKQVYDYFGGGADLVADIAGSPIAQHNCILSTAKLGCTVIIGISHQGLVLSELAVDRIMRGQISVKGSWNSYSSPFPGWEWTRSLELMEQRKINYKAVITHELPLKEIPSIFEQIYRGNFFYNKILFLPWK